jgi:signal transduction histidine kinase
MGAVRAPGPSEAAALWQPGEPLSLVEFAASRLLLEGGEPADLQAVLERLVTAWRGQAALVLLLAPAGPAEILAGYPAHAAADAGLAAAVGTLVTAQAAALGRGGTLEAPLPATGPGASAQASALIAVAEPDGTESGDGRRCVLALIGDPARWEGQAGAALRTIAVLVAARLGHTARTTRLRARAERQERFGDLVAHELRSPLGSIVSYAELIADEKDRLSPDAAGFLDVVQRRAEQLNQLIGDLLLLTRIDAGALCLVLGPVAVGEVVAQAVAGTALAAAERSVRVEASTSAGPDLLGDGDRLEQVVANLLSNAIMFSPAGVAVQVTASCSEGEWRVEVTDPGIGIPPAEIGRIGERFYRASNAGSADHRGSGLGFSIATALTQLHGGRIEVASTPGQGTRVRVSLPVRA